MSARANFVAFIFLQYVFYIHGFSFSERTANNRKCEPVTILPCRNIGYNLTRAVDMYSPIARNIENGRKYIHLLEQSSCSKHAVFLLCTLYSPVCFKNIEKTLLPCQSVCYKVKKRCGPLMQKFGIVWPPELDCKTLPEHNTGICIQPSSFQSANRGPSYRAKKDFEKRPSECNCRKKQNFKKSVKFRLYKKADFVIVGTVISRATTAHGRTKIFMNVTRIIKAGKVRPKLGKNKIWAPTTCICPPLQYDDHSYIMFGSENTERKRLEYNTKDRLLPYADVGLEKVEKWVTKCKKRKCNAS